MNKHIHFSESPLLKWLFRFISNYTVLHPGNWEPRAKYSQCQGTGKTPALIWNDAAGCSEVAKTKVSLEFISFHGYSLFSPVQFPCHRNTGSAGLPWFDSPPFRWNGAGFSSSAGVIVNYREIVTSTRSINYSIFKLSLVKQQLI